MRKINVFLFVWKVYNLSFDGKTMLGSCTSFALQISLGQIWALSWIILFVNVLLATLNQALGKLVQDEDMFIQPTFCNWIHTNLVLSGFRTMQMRVGKVVPAVSAGLTMLVLNPPPQSAWSWVYKQYRKLAQGQLFHPVVLPMVIPSFSCACTSMNYKFTNSLTNSLANSRTNYMTHSHLALSGSLLLIGSPMAF